LRLVFAETAAGLRAAPPFPRVPMHSVSILTRADPGAVGIVVAAAVIAAAIIAVGARRRGADCGTIDASAHRRARYGMIAISASDISSTRVSASGIPAAGISPTGDADTACMNAAAVKAPSSGPAAPTRVRVIRGEAGADQNKCCQSSKSVTDHGILLSIGVSCIRVPILTHPELCAPEDTF
jgi:hypothetical protein